MTRANIARELCITVIQPTIYSKSLFLCRSLTLIPNNYYCSKQKARQLHSPLGKRPGAPNKTTQTNEHPLCKKFPEGKQAGKKNRNTSQAFCHLK